MIAIFKKELWGYFGNWSAWIIITVFSIISALFLFFFENNFNIFDIGTASLQGFFTLCPWVFMLIIPALTMRSIAEEQNNGTLQWLFSQPLKIESIIFGKYFSVWLVGILCLVPSLIYLYTIYTLGIPEGNFDHGMTLGSYFGTIILIGAFSSLGILSSSLSSNQVMAYLVGLFLNFIFWFGIDQLASYKLMGGGDYILQNLGFKYHFDGFARGLVDSRDVFYYLIVIFLSLGLSYFLIQRKK